MNSDAVQLESWVQYDDDHDFSIYNIPFGIASRGTAGPQPVSRIGDKIIDLKIAANTGIFDTLSIPAHIWESSTLNDFIALGKHKTSQVRIILQNELTNTDSILKDSGCLVSTDQYTMHLPIQIGDYTDFYSSYYHAYNVGCMFRDPEKALMPNWKHLPVGYHGRSSSIVIDGTAIHRPMGQTLPANSAQPIFGPSNRMDFELEMATVIGQNTDLGQRVDVNLAKEYAFGMLLFNDWSARDIQKWEYVPLGPFLGKNFGSTVSPWIVTMEALAPFKKAATEQDPAVLPYLKEQERVNYDIQLEVGLRPKDGGETIISRSNYKYMYWSINQQIAHHTVNGCNLKIGDLMASGTISGPTSDSYGSMLELSWAGSKTIKLSNGIERKFIEDYDTVSLYGFGKKAHIRVGFGRASGTILPSLN